MIENEFVQSSLRILLEYGVPLSAVQKLQIVLQMNRINTSKITEDHAISFIAKYKDEIRSYLSEYEYEILERAI